MTVAGSWAARVNTGAVHDGIAAARKELIAFASRQLDLPEDDLTLDGDDIVSTSGENDEDLHNWVMDRYTSSLGLQQYHTETEANWACKVGLLPPLGAQPRPFIALHLCRQGARGTACAEVEEELEGIELTECINRPSCWKAKCEQRWDARSESVEAVVRNAVGER